MDKSEFDVAIDEAMSLLVVQPDYDDGNGPRPCVHTFRSSSFGLIGAHMGLDEVRAAFEKYGVAEAGDQAAAMKHGLVYVDEHGPMFLEAQPRQGLST